MARITITTNDGTVVETIKIGADWDLSKGIARQALSADVLTATVNALAREDGPTYRVVITNWWKEGDPKKYPDGLEPDGTIQRVLATGLTEDRAWEIARGWNATHNPGRLSTKAEVARE